MIEVPVKGACFIHLLDIKGEGEVLWRHSVHVAGWCSRKIMPGFVTIVERLSRFARESLPPHLLMWEYRLLDGRVVIPVSPSLHLPLLPAPASRQMMKSSLIVEVARPYASRLRTNLL